MASEAGAPGPEAWEQQLIRRARSGDTEAFGELLRHFQSRVYSLVRRLVRREAEAVELTQETFLQAFKAQHRFDETRAFRPWLFKIAVNVCRNHLRSGSRREQALEVSQEAVPMWQQRAESPESAAVQRDNTRLLEQHLARLRPEDRALLLLRFNEELEYDELRRVYGVPRTVLKMRVHRALARLRAVAGEALQ